MTFKYVKRTGARAEKRKGQSYKPSGTPPPGEGGRFRALVEALKKKGAKNPRALAAWIGRRKYGKKRFQKMSAEGRKRG